MTKKKLFFVLCNTLFLIISLSVSYFQSANLSVNPFREIVQNYQHFRTKINETEHYTLPLSNNFNSQNTENFVPSNISNESIPYDAFNFQNRGIVNCSHFESELTCSDVKYIRDKWNETMHSGLFLFLNVGSTSFEKELKTIAAAFLISIASNRRLIFTKNIKSIPLTTNITVRKPFNNSIEYRNIQRCEYRKILETNEKSIVISGVLDPVAVILDPFVYRRIKFPVTTHFMYLVSRFLYVPQDISFPDYQLQIGVSLEFEPNWRVFAEQMDEIIEGYTNYSLHFFNPSSIHIPRQVIRMLSERKGISVTINEYHHLKDCFSLILSCDHFFGSLGYWKSFLLTAFRGRGGHYINPKDSKIIETSSSQSGYIYTINQNVNTMKLMCPEGADSLQNFVSFLSF